MTRTGKIARLPKSIREELNRRLADGAEGTNLLDWLNAEPGVLAVLAHHFGGRPVSAQNLSQWRLGGFLEWQHQQEALEWAHCLTEEADDLEEEAGTLPLSDKLGPILTLTLGKLLRASARAAEEDPDRRAEVLVVAREISKLRNDDHAAVRLAVNLDDHEIAAAERSNARRRAREHELE